MAENKQPSEFSESGQPIYRYKLREKPFELAIGDVEHIHAIERHIEQHLGKPSWVFHEILSDLVHIDVHVINPRPERNFYTLVTTGMSARAMKTPKGSEERSYSELMLSLPPDWHLKQEEFKDENNYWPMRLLKCLARFPHEFDTWFSHGHTLPNGDPPVPYASKTKFCCAMLAPPILVPNEFRLFQIHPELGIHFLAVIPLYAEEVRLKLEQGAKALYDRFDVEKVNELIDLNRKNVAKKRLFGLF